jgi:ABC-2 type transport system ATP-binding protein
MKSEGSYAIEARGLTKRYGKLLAVDSIDFDIEGGEIFGFLGPNGAGKTTTVMMLTTFLEPAAGTIRVHGYDLSRESLKARALMGIVPEESNVYTELAAEDNLPFAGKIYRMPAFCRIHVTPAASQAIIYSSRSSGSVAYRVTRISSVIS